jgi:hypothetical protein
MMPGATFQEAMLSDDSLGIDISKLDNGCGLET